MMKSSVLLAVTLLLTGPTSLATARRGPPMNPQQRSGGSSRGWGEEPYSPPRFFDVRQVLVGTKDTEQVKDVNRISNNRKKTTGISGKPKAFMRTKDVHDVDELVYLSFHPF